MKSEKYQANVCKKYPYLGSYNGYVVLFTKPKSGFYVFIPEKDKDEEDPISLGYYSEAIIEEFFSIFEGVVTLSN